MKTKTNEPPRDVSELLAVTFPNTFPKLLNSKHPTKYRLKCSIFTDITGICANQNNKNRNHYFGNILAVSEIFHNLCINKKTPLEL